MGEYWLEYRVLPSDDWQRFNHATGGIDFLHGWLCGIRWGGFGNYDWRICKRTSVNTFEVVHLSLSATSEPDDGTELPQEGN